MSHASAEPIRLFAGLQYDIGNIDPLIPLVPASSHEFPRVPTSSHEFPRAPTSSHEFPRVPASSREFWERSLPGGNLRGASSRTRKFAQGQPHFDFRLKSSAQPGSPGSSRGYSRRRGGPGAHPEQRKRDEGRRRPSALPLPCQVRAGGRGWGGGVGQGRGQACPRAHHGNVDVLLGHELRSEVRGGRAGRGEHAHASRLADEADVLPRLRTGLRARLGGREGGGRMLSLRGSGSEFKVGPAPARIRPALPRRLRSS